MEWGDLESALSSEPPRDARGLPVALHFRIATHGKVKPGCSHLFAMCKDYGAMRAESASAAAGFMRNGTLAGLETSPDVSDNMAYARNVLAPLKGMRGGLSGAAQRRIVEATSQGSRFLLMTGDAHALTLGRWVADGGRLYSNESFRGRRRTGRRGTQASFFDVPRWPAAGAWPRGPFPACGGCPLAGERSDLEPWCGEAEEVSGMTS